MRTAIRDESLGEFWWGAIRMDVGLTGKVALAAGPRRCAGRGVALMLAREGCDVMLTGRNEAALCGAASAIGCS
jgi:hypothetical protein